MWDSTTNVEVFTPQKKDPAHHTSNDDYLFEGLRCSRCGLDQNEIETNVCPIINATTGCSALIGVDAATPGYGGIRCQNHYMCQACWFYETSTPYGDRNPDLEGGEFTKALVGRDKQYNARIVPSDEVNKCVGCWHDRRRKESTQMTRGLKRARSPATPDTKTSPPVIIISSPRPESRFPGAGSATPEPIGLAQVGVVSPPFIGTIPNTMLEEYKSLTSGKDIESFLQTFGQKLNIVDDS